MRPSDSRPAPLSTLSTRATTPAGGKGVGGWWAGGWGFGELRDGRDHHKQAVQQKEQQPSMHAGVQLTRQPNSRCPGLNSPSRSFTNSSATSLTCASPAAVGQQQRVRGGGGTRAGAGKGGDAQAKQANHVPLEHGAPTHSHAGSPWPGVAPVTPGEPSSSTNTPKAATRFTTPRTTCRGHRMCVCGAGSDRRISPIPSTAATQA